MWHTLRAPETAKMSLTKKRYDFYHSIAYESTFTSFTSSIAKKVNSLTQFSSKTLQIISRSPFRALVMEEVTHLVLT